MPATEIERLEQHLSECGPCLAALEQLKPADSLVEAVRDRTATPVPLNSETVHELMERLQGQPPSSALDKTTGSSGTPAPTSEDVTLAPVTAASPAGSTDATLPPVTATESPAANYQGRYDFLAPPQGANEIGRLGPYRVLAVLGAGGMGVVFRAEDTELERPVALKVMLPAMAENASARERFLREARTAAAIEHEHVVTIYRVGEDRGVPYLAMQLLRGESLDDRLQREKQLPIAEVLRVGREIALGLAAAHEHGLIHRDIKPANLWLEGERGRVKILDFGLARAARDTAHLTQSGLIIGTPAYMAPEQSRATGVDHRADLFSLGCVLYRCCTGQMPFKGTDTISILAALALDDPPPPHQLNAKVPPRLSKLVMLLLAKDPAGRPPSARSVVKAITTLETGGPSPTKQAVPKAPPAPQAERAKKTEILEALPAESASRKRSVPARRKRGVPAGRRWWRIGIAAAVLLAVLGPLGYWGATTIIRLANGKGQLIIDTDDPDVEVRVKQNGEQVTIIDAKTKKEITLQAGAYQLELVGGKDGLALSTNQFTLSRGGREVVKVRLESVDVAKKLDENKVGEIRRFEGHKNWACRVFFCPDGRRILASGADGTLRTWDIKTGKQLCVFHGHKWSSLWGLALSRNGKLALSAGEDAILSWNMQTGKEIRRYPFHSSDVALSPDNRYGLASCGGGDFCLWSLETGKEVRRFRGHKDNVWPLCFSSDGHRVLSGSGFPTGDRTVRLWETETGKELRCFQGHTGQVITVAFSPDDNLIASGSLDHTIRLWNTKTGDEIRSFRGHTDQVISVAFSPDGLHLLSGSGDRSMRLWNVATGKELYRFEADKIQVRSVAFSADGRYALSGGADGVVRLWRLPDLSADKPGAENKPQPLAPDEVRRFVGHRGPVRGVAISPDGTRALSASGYPYGDRTIRLWDLKTGQQIRTFTDPEMQWVYHAAFLPDGRRALSVSNDIVLRLWDLETGKILRRFRGVGEPLIVTRDGRQALLGHPNDTAIHVWDVETGKELRRFIGHSSRPSCLALSPDGHTLLSGSGDATMRLWDMETGKELRQFPGHTGPISSVAFSPDGLLAASGCPHEEMVRLWNVKTGKELRRLKGHHGRIPQVLFQIGVAFLPDGQRLLSWSHDKTLRLWDIETGKELHCFTGHQNWIWDAALTPKGDFALSGGGGAFEGKWTAGSDFSLRLWKIPNLPPKKVGAAEKPQPPRRADRATDQPVSAPPVDEKIPAPFLVLRPRAIVPTSDKAVHAAALSYPYVYLLGRFGKGLWVFKLPTKKGETVGQELAEVGHIDAAGDGGGLTILGDTLLCTSRGGLEAFSLKDPIRPRFLGRFGPQGSGSSKALVSYKDRVILIGQKNLSVFDVSHPTRPHHLGSTPIQGFKWNGCVLGDRLFVAEIQLSNSRNSRNGISVFDLRDPTHLTEQTFVATKAPSHLLPVGSDRFVSLAGDSAQLFRVTDGKPTPVGESIAASGRSGTVLTLEGKSYLITCADVIRIEDKELISINRYRGGCAFDGTPYPASSQGQYAIIPGSLWAIALRPESRLAAPFEPPPFLRPQSNPAQK